MKWSWRIATVAGIGIYIHATFLILIAWFILGAWTEQHSLSAAARMVLFILSLFGCILLHELGHALMAKRYGIRTRDITLLPIGGVARLERMPDDPKQELWVALAGPAVNVVIAGVLIAFLVLTGRMPSMEQVEAGQVSLPVRLMSANVFLVLFNLLPAFPMDGGRVLRALLARKMDYARATQVAATIGQGMAFLFGLVGLFWNPMLLFIALFVYIGAAQEASMAMMRSALGGIPVSRAMVTDFRTLTPVDQLSHVIELILAGSQHDFPVVEEGRVVGVLARSDLMAALAQRERVLNVGMVMRREFPTVDPAEMLEAALARISAAGTPAIPVLRNGSLVGLLTMDNIGEFLMIQGALVQGRPPRR